MPLENGHSYPRIYHAWRLYEHDLLDELDTAYSDAGRRGIQASENIRLDFGHRVPVLLIVRIRDSASTFI